MAKIIRNLFDEIDSIVKPELLLDASDCKLLLEELDHHTCKLSNYQPFHDLLKLVYKVANPDEDE